jgi:hypothetical protein
MNKKCGLLLLCALTLNSLCIAQRLKPLVRTKVTPPAQKEQFELYWLIGQSNMAGRGYPEPIDTTANIRVLRLNKSGEWEEAKEPIHFDKPEAGVGPGLAFGKAMTAGNTKVIGLVPCAVGGSGIEVWKAGVLYPPTNTKPYDDAIARIKLAMQNGTLKGIIWNQGEADANLEKSKDYEANLKALISTIRTDLAMPNVPFVAGQLPGFQIHRPDKEGKPTNNIYVTEVNKAIFRLKGSVLNYDYVEPNDTYDLGDHLHYNAASARLMGERYAAAMTKLLKNMSSKDNKNKK